MIKVSECFGTGLGPTVGSESFGFSKTKPYVSLALDYCICD